MKDGVEKKRRVRWFFVIEMAVVSLVFLITPTLRGTPTAFGQEGTPPDRVIKFTGDANWVPYQFLNASGEPDGFSVDLVRALCQEQALRCEIELYQDWAQAQTDVADGLADAVLGLAKTPEREPLFDFSQYIAHLDGVIAVREDTITVHSLEDLHGTSIAVVGGTPYYAQLSEDTHFNVVPVRGEAEGLRKLANREVKALISGELTIRYTAQYYGIERLKIVGRPIWETDYAIGVKKGNKQLLETINAGLSALESKGVVDELTTKWFGAEIRVQELPAWVRWTAGAALSIGILIVVYAFVLSVFNRRLTAEVRRRTAELEGEIRERKRAEEALRRRNEELAIFNAIAAVVSQSLDLEEVLDAALGKTLAALNADGGLIYLFDETSQTFAPVVHYGISQAVLQEVTGFKPGEGLSGHVAKSGRPLVTALGKNARDIPPSGIREGLRSYAGVPIRSRGKVLGVMTLVSHQEDYFKPDHLGLLSHIGNQVGMAIENARLYEAEHAARQQLRDLANYLQTAREEERAYIAREVHDEFGQALTALKMDLSWLAKRLPKDAPSLAEKASIMSDLIDYTIHTVRHIATELRPGLLDDLGLVAAIEWQTQEFAERTEIDCELYTSHEEIALNPDLATAVFRIFQETLTNIARHAQATEVRIELEVSPDELTLLIRDNGQGITEGDIYNSRSLGLMGMRERARSWGGDVTFEGVSGQGTTVTVQIPRPNT